MKVSMLSIYSLFFLIIEPNLSLVLKKYVNFTEFEEFTYKFLNDNNKNKNLNFFKIN